MHTKRSRTLAMVAVLASAVTAGAAESIPDTTSRIQLAPGSRLTLRGKSTLHDYASTATQLQLAVELAAPEAASELARLAAPGAVKSIVLTVPVLGMKSEKDGLDKNMYKALKATANPNIVFRLQSATPGPNGAAFHVAGELEVAGQLRPVEMDVRASESSEGIVLEGSKALLMSDFGIKPPSMFLGTLKTDDRVVIEWRLVLAHAGF